MLNNLIYLGIFVFIYTLFILFYSESLLFYLFPYYINLSILSFYHIKLLLVFLFLFLSLLFIYLPYFLIIQSSIYYKYELVFILSHYNKFLKIFFWNWIIIIYILSIDHNELIILNYQSTIDLGNYIILMLLYLLPFRFSTKFLLFASLLLFLILNLIGLKC